MKCTFKKMVVHYANQGVGKDPVDFLISSCYKVAGFADLQEQAAYYNWFLRNQRSFAEGDRPNNTIVEKIIITLR